MAFHGGARTTRALESAHAAGEHGDGGNLGLVDHLLITVGIGQQHTVLIEAADHPFELNTTDQEDGDLTTVFSQPVEGGVLAISQGEGLF